MMAGFDVTDPNSPVDQRESTNVQTSEGTQSLLSGRDPKDVPLGDLREWWLERADSEVAPLVAKMEEYGGLGRAQDLIDIGRDLHALRGTGDTISDEEATELGIYFYMRGKFSRWTAAVIESRRVSDDTLLDIGVYDRMAQRNREVGGWPQ